MVERTDRPVGADWRPVRDLPPECREWRNVGARDAGDRWAAAWHRVKDRDSDRALMDMWFLENRRLFAIETGQVEGLYLLTPDMTVQLMTVGFGSVRGTDSFIPIEDCALRGLLEDQQTTLEMVNEAGRNGRRLDHGFLQQLHALLTRHQESAPGVTPDGRRVAIPLLRGEYKRRPNNPRRRDGFVHEYCPPEHVRSEMDRFLEFHRGHRDLGLSPEVEAAWLHHEFVRIHPFQDGNGRMSRLLVAWAYAKAGEFPPIIMLQDKHAYIVALDAADRGNFRVFVDWLGTRAGIQVGGAALRAGNILAGRRHHRHANGGMTSNGIYYPPEEMLPIIWPDPDSPAVSAQG